MMQSMIHRHFSFLLLCTTILFSTAASAETKTTEEEFPGRKLYPAVPFIEIDDLAANYDKYQIVDVRSPYEYSVLRVKDAVNVPLASANFIKNVIKLQEADARPIVMYCNGKTCMKSYKAVNKTRLNKLKNIMAYDRGIMDWARNHPDKAVLLDQTPIDPSKLISKASFKKHLVDPEKFELQVAEQEPVVIDIRDRSQREGLRLFVGLEEHVNISDKEAITRLIRKANRENKPVYVYDMAGKQVRWLQYLLEDQHANSYYFMKGGTRAYFNKMLEQYKKS